MAGAREILGATIVAVGEFLPSVMTPEWFAEHELIGADDLKEVKEGEFLVSRTVTSFHTAWLAFQATLEQVVFGAVGPVTPQLCDSTVGVLSLLTDMKISAIGMNFMAHYKLDSIEEYQKFGDVLAPKEIWNQIFPNRRTGLLNMQVVAEAPAGADPTTRVNVTVQPSNRIKNGIFISINDHRPILKKQTDNETVQIAAELIHDHWQASWDQAMQLFETVVNNATTR